MQAHTPAQTASTSTTATTYSLLAAQKTAQITLTPRWNQEQSTHASLCVILAPKLTSPEYASWKIELNLVALDNPPTTIKKKEEAISKKQRAILWYEGNPFPKYKPCMILSNCQLSTNDELKTHSIVLRPHQEEKIPNTLVWVKKQIRTIKTSPSNFGYLQVVKGHKYNLSITFSVGSTILQRISPKENNWSFHTFLHSKHLKNNAIETKTRLLGPNEIAITWAANTEPDLDEHERLAFANPMNLTPAPLTTSTTTTKSDTSNPISLTWEALEKAINTNSPIELPSLDPAVFHPDFSLELPIERFEDTILTRALDALETDARTVATDLKSPYYHTATFFLNFLRTTAFLPGHQHLQRYIENSQLYTEDIKKAKTDEKIAIAMSRGTDEKKPIDGLQIKGQALLKNLCQRIDWLQNLPRKTNEPLDTKFYIKVLNIDKTWMDNTTAFMKECEQKVTKLFAKSPPKFHAFREFLRIKGNIPWPHSSALYKQIIDESELAHRPNMLDRDICKCSTCNVEFSGWRSWHNNPRRFHNLSRHPAGFFPPPPAVSSSVSTSVSPIGTATTSSKPKMASE